MLFPSDNEHFNSIKVRLNRVPARDGFADSRFQFHKGTIKPVGSVAASYAVEQFQFHKGTIKPFSNVKSDRVGRKFQFHKGTIKPLEQSEGV